MSSFSLGQRALSAILSVAVFLMGLYPHEGFTQETPTAHRFEMPFPDDQLQADAAAENICQSALAQARRAQLAPEKVTLVISVYETQRQVPAFVENIIMKCRGLGLSVRRVKIKKEWNAFVDTINKKVPYELEQSGANEDAQLDTPEFEAMVDHFMDHAKNRSETEAAYAQIAKLPRAFYKRLLKNTLLQFKKFFGVYNGISLSVYTDNESGLRRPWKNRILLDENGKVSDVIGGAKMEFAIKGHLLATTFLFTFIALTKHFGEMPETLNPAYYLNRFGEIGNTQQTLILASSLAAAAWQGFHTFFGQANLKFLTAGKRYFPRLNRIEKVYQWSIPAQMLLSSLAKFTVPLLAYGIDGTYERIPLIASNLLLGAFAKNPFQAAIAGLKKSRSNDNITHNNGAKSDKVVMWLDAVVQTGFTFLAFSHLLSFTQSIPGVEGIARQFGTDSISFIFWTLGISGIGYEVLKHYRGEVRAPLSRKAAWEAIAKNLAHDLKKMGTWLSLQKAPEKHCQVHLQVIPTERLSNKKNIKERKQSIANKLL